MNKKIYNFSSTLELENYVNKLRLNHAKKVLANDINVNLQAFDEKGLIDFYAILEIKDRVRFGKK